MVNVHIHQFKPGGAVVDAVRGQAWPAFPEWLQRRLTVGGPLVRREIVPDVDGRDQALRGVVMPIGVNGEGGLVAAAGGAGFPGETDQLLLSVAANHAATAFQSARLIDAHRRADDWFADVSRNRHEQDFMEYVARFLPTAVPRLVHGDADNGFFLMEYLGPDIGWDPDYGGLYLGPGWDFKAGHRGSVRISPLLTYGGGGRRTRGGATGPERNLL